MKKNLIIAPHADDETLGCGGTILKLKKRKESVNCIILSNYNKINNKKLYNQRLKELSKIKKHYKFDSFYLGEFTANTLDNNNKTKIISLLKIISNIKPKRIFVPYYNDAHSDHKTVLIVVSLFKSFDTLLLKRFMYMRPFLRRILIIILTNSNQIHG